MRLVRNGLAIENEHGQRVLWAGYASARGCSMKVSDEEKERVLAFVVQADETLGAIVGELTGREWDSDTPDRIAKILQAAGYVIDGPACEHCGESPCTDFQEGGS